jgi:hypothetical protein
MSADPLDDGSMNVLKMNKFGDSFLMHEFTVFRGEVSGRAHG